MNAKKKALGIFQNQLKDINYHSTNENYCNSFAHYLTSLKKQLYKCAIYIEHVLLMLCRTMFTKDSIRRNPSSAYFKTLLQKSQP